MTSSKMPPIWPPSLILQNIQNYPNTEFANTYFATVVKYDIIEHSAAFGSVLRLLNSHIFIKKQLDLVLLMMSILVTLATDCRQT